MDRFLAVLLLLAAVIGGFVDAKKKGMLEVVTLHIPEDCSDKAEVGDEVAVHYVGKLESGAVFDMSKLPDNSRDPIRFQLGKNKVIKGWEEGIKGMCVGEHRKLVIPPHLGYGKQAQGNIPPDSTLIFTVELMELKKPSFLDSLSATSPFIVGPGIVVIIGLYLWRKASTDSTQKTKVKREQKQKKKK
ncbi:FK506-binding protein 2-like [Acanthaster planci]|uniref:peptidylprolyl isomerase n=1 Tax=Acanthaster planci TaxID=133434 RepID=A0A8B7ZMG3_ACAPL|nr:FK506-binding protein 2-like [Acanthaster planci]